VDTFKDVRAGSGGIVNMELEFHASYRKESFLVS